MINKSKRNVRFSGDDGSIFPIAIFGVVFTLALSLTLSSATAVLNQQRFLESVAQGLALDSVASRLELPAKAVSISDLVQEKLIDISAINGDLENRLRDAELSLAQQNTDGSVVVKVCQPPRLVVANQFLILGRGLGSQVCASAAAVNK